MPINTVIAIATINPMNAIMSISFKYFIRYNTTHLNRNSLDPTQTYLATRHRR